MTISAANQPAPSVRRAKTSQLTARALARQPAAVARSAAVSSTGRRDTRGLGLTVVGVGVGAVAVRLMRPLPHPSGCGR